MRISQNLAVLALENDFPSRLIPFPQEPSKQNQLFWKGFFLLLTFLFALFFFPIRQEENRENILSSGNLIQLVNQDRMRAGLSPLRASVKLEQAARAKARHMLKENYFAHTSPTGTEPWKFIETVGLQYSFAGENLALNYTNAHELLENFMASPSHRENLLSPLFSETGIAVVQGTFDGKPAVITVQMFASPALESVASH